MYNDRNADLPPRHLGLKVVAGYSVTSSKQMDSNREYKYPHPSDILIRGKKICLTLTRV